MLKTFGKARRFITDLPQNAKPLCFAQVGHRLPGLRMVNYEEHHDAHEYDKRNWNTDCDTENLEIALDSWWKRHFAHLSLD
ncbi:MAG TPA: hypothetical protein DDZ51_22885 [Planctomycetaceae bacterium]|nr:hypothetical protein [Planctomycetaceae bacterium]